MREYLLSNPEIAAEIEAKIRAILLPDKNAAKKTAADESEPVAQEA